MTEITFDFACTDDCLNKMVPSDLRQLVSERDTLRQRVRELEAEFERLRGALLTGASLLEQGCNATDMADSMRRAATEPKERTK